MQTDDIFGDSEHPGPAVAPPLQNQGDDPDDDAGDALQQDDASDGPVAHPFPDDGPDDDFNDNAAPLPPAFNAPRAQVDAWVQGLVANNQLTQVVYNRANDEYEFNSRRQAMGVFNRVVPTTSLRGPEQHSEPTVSPRQGRDQRAHCEPSRGVGTTQPQPLHYANRRRLYAPTRARGR